MFVLVPWPRTVVCGASLLCWLMQFAGDGVGDAAPILMAVVLQVMVDPKCAGVMFTIDPLSGDSNSMRLEGVWGLGEGLVSERYIE